MKQRVYWGALGLLYQLSVSLRRCLPFKATNTLNFFGDLGGQNIQNALNRGDSVPDIVFLLTDLQFASQVKPSWVSLLINSE